MSTDVERLRALAEAATPGPWDHAHEGLQGGEVIRTIIGPRIARVYRNDLERSCENAAFIAAADPTTVLALLDELAALRGRHP